jgi:adenine-specific DNA-methyltransferase
VRAFRDTWRDGIHSYLTYLRDRLTVARDLLSDSGSVFMQIGDENVHRVRSLMDEVFGDENFVALISFTKTSGLEATGAISGAFDYLLWYAKRRNSLKYRPIIRERTQAAQDRFSSVQMIDGTSYPLSEELLDHLSEEGTWHRVFTDTDLTKPGPGAKYEFEYNGRSFTSGNRWWGTQISSLERVGKAHRLFITGRGKLRFVRGEEDTGGQGITNNWSDIGGSVQSRSDPKVYVVQTGTAVVQRCMLLMATDPGDLVLDPTCGSGTTAYVAEQWGRRWITDRYLPRCAGSWPVLASWAPATRTTSFADTESGVRKEAELRTPPPRILGEQPSLRGQHSPRLRLRARAHTSR